MANDFSGDTSALTIDEQAIIGSILERISKDKNSKTTTYKINELADVLMIEKEDSFEFVKNLAMRLLSRTLKLDKKGSSLPTHWFYSVYCDETKGLVSFTIGDKVKENIMELKDKFSA